MKKLMMKTAVLSALAAVMVTATAAAAVIGTGVVDADALRVRSQPNTTSSTLTYLTDGTKVEVHEALDSWYKVSYGAYSGYVHADYLDYTPAASAPAASTAPAETAVADKDAKDAVITGSDVNFRAEASTSATVISVLQKDAKVKLVSVADGWCKIIVGDKTGYVSADYVTVNGIAAADPRGIVTGDCVNVRGQASTSGTVLKKVYAGEILELVALKDNWYTITVDGKTGYISADYVRPYTKTSTSAIGDQVAALALKYLGTPYVYGGASAKGFDCSGFTMFVFKQFGYNLPHSATSQWFSSGVNVERKDLQPGDLVLFCDPSRSNGKACSHVGIYIGDGQFVHASSGSSGKYVRISSLSEGYYNTYYKGAKRLG